jgi:hypothetical protein
VKLFTKSLAATVALALIPAAMAGKFDACPDPAAAEQFVKACMQENPYNTREACEERALKKLCAET